MKKLIYIATDMLAPFAGMAMYIFSDSAMMSHAGLIVFLVTFIPIVLNKKA